jgi:5,10-methylenetetrahydromethanopterin reductase
MSVTFGFTTMALDPPDTFVRLVQDVEASGFDFMWVADSSLHARYCYSYLTLVATHTRRLRLGPNCTHPYTRHPAISMNAIATIDEISGGRAIMNLGAGDRPVTEVGYQPAKMKVIREMVDVCRRLQREEQVDFTGEAWSLHRATLHFKIRGNIPIYLTATGPKMLQMAGEIADGIIFMPGTYQDCVRFALENLEIGARRAGRALADLDVAWCGIGAIDRDRATAIEASQWIGAWFPQTSPQYAEIAGVPAQLSQRIRAAYSGGHFHEANAAAALVTPEMIERLALAGTPADIRTRLGTIIDLGVTHIEWLTINQNRLAAVRLFADEVIPHFR